MVSITGFQNRIKSFVKACSLVCLFFLLFFYFFYFFINLSKAVAVYSKFFPILLYLTRKQKHRHKQQPTDKFRTLMLLLAFTSSKYSEQVIVRNLHLIRINCQLFIANVFVKWDYDICYNFNDQSPQSNHSSIYKLIYYS